MGLAFGQGARNLLGRAKAAIPSAIHCSSIRDAIAELTTQLEEWGYPYDIVQLRWTKGDNGGPDESVMPTVRDWNAKYAWPKLIISTTSEMFHEFERDMAINSRSIAAT